MGSQQKTHLTFPPRSLISIMQIGRLRRPLRQCRQPYKWSSSNLVARMWQPLKQCQTPHSCRSSSWPPQSP